jgi:cytoskeletal protein CcmA (bactofilin family)
MFGGSGARSGKDFERPPRPGAPAKDNLLERDDDDLPDRFGAAPDFQAAPAYSSYLSQSARSGPTPPEGCASVVASGSTWKGTLTVDSSVRVDGQLNGEINAKDTVHIAEGAKVDAKIQAAYVVVAGTFQGQMRCKERLELLPKSRVRGEITAKLLTVHEGAFIDGHVQMTTDEPAATDAMTTSRSTSGGRSSSSTAKSLAEPVAAANGSAAVSDLDSDK